MAEQTRDTKHDLSTVRADELILLWEGAKMREAAALAKVSALEAEVEGLKRNKAATDGLRAVATLRDLEASLTEARALAQRVGEERDRAVATLAYAAPLINHLAGEEMSLTLTEGREACSVQACELAASALGIEIGMSEWVELVATGALPAARFVIEPTEGENV